MIRRTEALLITKSKYSMNQKIYQKRLIIIFLTLLHFQRLYLYTTCNHNQISLEQSTFIIHLQKLSNYSSRGLGGIPSIAIKRCIQFIKDYSFALLYIALSSQMFSEADFKRCFGYSFTRERKYNIYRIIVSFLFHALKYKYILEYTMPARLINFLSWT